MEMESSSKSDEYYGGWDNHGFEADRIVQLRNLSQLKKYRVSNVKFVDPTDPSSEDAANQVFGDLVDLRPGGIYTKKDLSRRLESLSSSRYFQKVDFDAQTNYDGTLDIHIPFQEKIFPPKNTFKCLSIGELPDPNKRIIGCARDCILPRQVQQRIDDALTTHSRSGLRSSLLRRIVTHVNKWYRDNGFYAAHVVRHGPLEDDNGQIIFEVNEGDIAGLDIRFQDGMGKICKGNTNIDLIKRALPKEVSVGKAFNILGLEKAYHNISSLNLFSSVDIVPKSDLRSGAVCADIVLQEHPQKWRVNSTIKFQPGSLPKLMSLQPGTNISFERRNIKGLNRSFRGALAFPNTIKIPLALSLLPEDVNLEYTHPYMDGINDPRNRTFKAACFTTKQQSPLFKCGPSANDKPIRVDRKGIKATITENYTTQSKFTYGVMMEDIRSRDEDGSIASTGHRLSFNGLQNRNTRPDRMTLSGTGVDRMATFQANLTRDNTCSINGAAVVGAVDVIQVDQGIGIGSWPALFNRLQMSVKRFIPLGNVQEGAGAPPVLVLHGAFGNCLGNVPNHEAFAIGGPNSVRGYNVGEIGASRTKLEVSAEIRVPVKCANLYGFIEHGNDLGGSVGSAGNRTRGHGSSAGVGIQLGPVRAEYVVDDNSRKGSFLFHLGEGF